MSPRRSNRPRSARLPYDHSWACTGLDGSKSRMLPWLGRAPAPAVPGHGIHPQRGGRQTRPSAHHGAARGDRARGGFQAAQVLAEPTPDSSVALAYDAAPQRWLLRCFSTCAAGTVQDRDPVMVCLWRATRDCPENWALTLYSGVGREALRRADSPPRSARRGSPMPTGSRAPSALREGGRDARTF
jgi:hypothetical protein